MKIENTFNELLSHPWICNQREQYQYTPPNHSNMHLSPLHRRADIQEKIKMHQGLSASDHQKASSKLGKDALTLAVPEASGLYHARLPEMNKIKLFFSGYETELPELSSIQQLSEKEQAFYEVRYIAKRGRNMHTNLSIDTVNNAGSEKSPKLMAQTATIRAIRSEAATSTVDRYTNAHSNYIAQLYKHVMGQLSPQTLREGGQVHLVRPTCHHYAGDATMNFLTFCTQTEIARTLNHIEQAAAKEDKRPPIEFTDHKSCITISRTERTAASPIGRLVQQGYFATDEIDQHDQLILVDDHVQVGGSILAMAAAAKAAGANILGLCALTTHPHSVSLELREDVKEHLLQTMQQWDPEHLVLTELQSMGMPVDTLTNAEALILIAYATNPHHEYAVRRFHEIEESISNHQQVMDGEHDALGPVLDKIPSAPHLIVTDMRDSAKVTRKKIEHTPVTRVEVLDWDCCITNEKAMNYELMVNALAVAAHEYADKYPELRELNKAVRPYIQGAGYQEGMPKLCMGADRFTEFGIMHPEFWKKHMVVDLLDKAHTIAPALQMKADHWGPIISILQREFNRQYKAFTRPPVPKEVQDRMQAIEQAKGIERPFNNIELKFMPGAQAFLEAHRKPNTRLLLISNKRDHDVDNEVNKLSVAHYFDHMSGVETVSDAGEVKTRGGKPKSDRLKHALEKQALNHRPLHVRLVGDQTQDIMQGEDLLADPRKRITGLLVAPRMPVDLINAEQKGIPVQYVPTLEHVKTQLITLRSKL